MLCSNCKKHPATIFINEPTKEDKNNLVGYCTNCAKEKGISVEHTETNNNNNNINNNINFDQMASQIGVIFKDLSNGIHSDNIDMGNYSDADSIPIGSIFGAMFNPEMMNNIESNSTQASNGNKKVKVEKKHKEKKKRILDAFGTNLTFKAKHNELDIVVGRDKEISRVIQILNRRTKNNPCLIGEPGVGKTAIAQGLAIKIASGNVPAKLINKEVYLLDMTAVVAGTQFRGQFEGRMKAIIDECKSLGNIILVIDEIHNIIGAGDSENSMSAANILKPSLANGEIQLIGTTTLREYRKYIEKDSALERRFQSVLVEEPDINDSTRILEGIKKYYEDYHKVKISKDVIKKTVIMSEKYIHDRFLPDKAIDILDEACSRKNLDNVDLFKLEVLKNKLATIQVQKEEAAQADSTEDYQKAADLKTQECKLIEDIDKLNKKIKLPNITEEDIAKVIENWTKIPVQKITETETDTETETETETEAEAGILRREDGPAFSTDGITVSASLDVADLVEEVMPQVVSVTATSLQTVRDFFYGTQEILQTDAGSGIIIDRDDQYLYIVTDAVIVNDVQDVTVGFCVKKEAAEELKDEDTVAQAEVMGIDEESLLAVIRVAEDQINETVLSAVKTAVLGDSDQIRVGEKVFAIGNAMGRGLSVTQGIVSAVKRSMRYGAVDHELIQTDASINYGNYGGALLNADGEVIGINAGKITENASEGMGFAYPVNDAKEAISRMLEKTGAGAVTETEESKDAAAKEKAQTGEETEEAKHTLTLALAEEESESSSPDKEKESETQPAEEQIRMPESEDTKKEEAPSESEKAGTEPAAATDDQGQLGIQVGEFSKEDQIIYRIPAGVVVAVVSEGSGAQAAQLAAGDLITGINDTRVESVGELKEALSGLKRGDKVKVSFLRPDSDGVYHKDKETEVTVTLQ